jgi:hypothetical protein
MGLSGWRAAVVNWLPLAILACGAWAGMRAIDALVAALNLAGALAHAH